MAIEVTHSMEEIILLIFKEAIFSNAAGISV